jgi:hypothetical protein
MNTAIGTPQARWREITQSGRLSIMPVMRFSPCAGTQRVTLIASSARWRSVSPLLGDVLVHRNEPLRRVAENHRLLRAPRMRVLMLQPPARDQHAGVDQGLDHRLVGVALFALLGQHALAGEARRLIGEAAVGIDGVGNRVLMPRAASFGALAVQTSKSSRPCPGAVCTKPVPGIFGDVIAGEKRDGKSIAGIEPFKRMSTDDFASVAAGTDFNLLVSQHPRLAHHVDGELVGRTNRSPFLAQFSWGVSVTS